MSGIRLRFFAIAILPMFAIASGEAEHDAENRLLPAVDFNTPVPGPLIPVDETANEGPFSLPNDVNIRNMGGRIEGNPQEGWLKFGGPVKINTDTGIEAFANRARLDTIAKTITLDGDVSIYRDNTLQRGALAVYHYETKFLDTTGLRASMDPIILESGKFTGEEINGRMIFTGNNAGITTHDDENPNFWMRASRITVYPDDRIVFRNMRFLAGGVPFFWLPYLSQPLDSELGYHFTPGSRSNWGPFLLNRYGIMLGGETDPVTGEKTNAWLLSRWRMDLRARRGVGLGLDLVDTRIYRENPNITGLSLYYLHDLDTDATRLGRATQGSIHPDRYRLELKHRHQLQTTGGATWWADANITWLSDERFLDDFEPQRFWTDPAPDNTLGIFRRDENSLLSFFSRLRVNDFYRSDTRMPEISFDQSSRPIFNLPILHEGTTSWGYLQEQAGDATRRAILDPLFAMEPGDPKAQALINQLIGSERVVAERISQLPLNDPRRKALSNQLLDFGYARFHTYHEFSMPFRLANVLNINPQAGMGYTRYDAVDSPLANFDRTHFHFSTEASVKFSRRYAGAIDPAWGLNGINHIVQPYAQWSFLTTDSTDSTFIGIDRLTPTTRPQPLDPLRFAAIDGLEDWSTIRLGGRNRLITNRNGHAHEWMYLDSFIDVFLNDPEGDRDYSNFNNAIRWQPLPWLLAGASAQFPITSNSSGFNEYESYVRVMPTSDLEVRLGHRYLSGHPILFDSNYLDLSLYKRINENWGLGTRHSIQMRDGTLEVQQYTVHRNFGSWIAGLGFTHRDNRIKDEYGVVFSFTLKEFPSISLPFKIDAQ